jgi:hypothetical protein
MGCFISFQASSLILINVQKQKEQNEANIHQNLPVQIGTDQLSTRFNSSLQNLQQKWTSFFLLNLLNQISNERRTAKGQKGFLGYYII